MHAEECGCMGLKSNFFCRTCKVGGTQAQKKTDKGYQNIFRCQEAQTPQEMQAQILQQLDYSLESSETEKVKVAGTNSGICDSNTASIIQHLLVLGKQLRKYNSVKTDIPETEVRLQLEWELESLLDDSTIEDHINPLLGMPGVNIHQDNPTKVLHTVGVVKYFWAQKDGLIGKHFKSLAQVMPYLIYDLVLQDVLNGWCVIGNLVVLLRHTKIDNAEVYLALFSIQQSFALQDAIKHIATHIATGGYWQDNTTKNWLNTGQAIQEYSANHPEQ
ncbi:hypothetical protein SERLA73DRAFT_149329 [Serpula lacrymans var. lacrymans S7.3]|uniref:Uncharacterized protein n=1 Tax=Serpula lacrymans var. lacrymans (strain S7.3) TaxID=936435 RepID=F8PHR3_SERL3|nr:hypothetical protein SERLA73DRAFT_149329 [Serpula lacrymans var. lacrymans S7.3]